MNNPHATRRKVCRNFIKKLGFAHLLTRIEKSPNFWKIMYEDFFWVRAIPGDWQIPLHAVRIFREYSMIAYYSMEHHVGELRMTSYEQLDVLPMLEMAISICFGSETSVYKQMMPLISELRESDETGLVTFLKNVQHFAALLSAPDSFTYYIEFDIKSVPSASRNSISPTASQLTVSLYRRKPDHRTLTLDGKKRTLYRLEYWIPLTDVCEGAVLYIDEHEFDIYIQGHALHRLEERLDTMSKARIYSNLAHYMTRQSVIEYNDTLLVQFSIGPKPVGYFVVEIHNNYALLKTFLFITHDGTPEGDQLTAELKLNKREKGFLNLDTLSGFTDSDLHQDPVILQVLKRCKLDHLHTLADAEIKQNSSVVHSAEFLRDMLQLQENPLAVADESESLEEREAFEIDTIPVPKDEKTVVIPQNIRELYTSPNPSTSYANVRSAVQRCEL